MLSKRVKVNFPIDSTLRIASSSEVGNEIVVLDLAAGTPQSVLALGGETDAAVGFLNRSTATVCSHLGNLNDPRQYRAFCKVIDELEAEMKFKPDLIAHDLHPKYRSTRLASQKCLPIVGVQRHHAQVAGVMAEQRITKPIIGICCDGGGLGTDNATWGCEILQGRPGDFRRVGHLEYFPLLGRDAAAVETWRPAMALVQQALGAEWQSAFHGCLDEVPAPAWQAAMRFANSNRTKPQTSSLARVFDGVSFLLGLCRANTFAFEAAIALENAANCENVEPYPYETRAGLDGLRMSLSVALRAILRDMQEGSTRNVIASRFHETVARMLSATALMAAERAGVKTIVLAGDCFANTRLRKRVTERLEQRRCEVIIPQRIDFGGASLALGQAVIAAATDPEKAA